MMNPSSFPAASHANHRDLQPDIKAVDHGDNDYCAKYLPPSVLERLQAAAFRSLCQHLHERSDQVSNMDLMTVSGFCRNCLAKWLVLAARRWVDKDPSLSTWAQEGRAPPEKVAQVRLALNGLGYEEAAQHVYGTTYETWKRRHQKKATDEQMQRYEASQPLHAVHDMNLLAPRDHVQPPLNAPSMTNSSAAATIPDRNTAEMNVKPRPLLSEVCCEDVEAVAAAPTRSTSTTKARSGPVPMHHPPGVVPIPPPAIPSSIQGLTLRLAILTVSDRAFRNEYATGDLSGPAVLAAVQQGIAAMEPSSLLLSPTTAIVPDDRAAIQTQIKAWCQPKDDQGPPMHLVFTTGGTGFGPRDVTPEATRDLLDQECSGLMSYVITESSLRLPPSQQAWASLSRGTAGVYRSTMVANLPGHPQAVEQIMPVLLPLAWQVVAQLHEQNQQ